MELLLPNSHRQHQNLFNNNINILSTTTSALNVGTNNANPSVLLAIWDNKGIGNNLFGSQAAMASPRENNNKTIKMQQEIDDFLYELPNTRPPGLELGDGLIQTLRTEAEDLFDANAPPHKKEEDEVLNNLMDEYKIDDIKDAMDETAQMPESIYFFFMVETVKNLLMHSSSLVLNQ